jgi:hypothetical protein
LFRPSFAHIFWFLYARNRAELRKTGCGKNPENGVGAPLRGVRNRTGAFLPLARRSESVTTPVLVPLSPDGYQMNGLKAVFAAFER